VTVWIAVAIAALAGVLLGAPTLRLRGDYLAIVTLGFGEIVPLLFKNLDKLNVNIAGNSIIGPNFNLTGGVLGINPIDPPTLPNPFGKEIVFSNSNPHASLYLILLILVVVFFLIRRLRDSRLGRAWMAIREDETAAAAMGINTVSTKLLAFSLGASCSGFVGAFVSSYQTAVFPESFNFAISITILIMVVLGGMGSLRGAVLGAFALSYVSETFLPWAGTFVNPPINSLGDATHIAFFTNFTLSAYNYLIFGVVLVLMMIFRPEGLLPSATRRAELHGEGISAESTFGTTSSVAEAATEFEEATGTLPPEEQLAADEVSQAAEAAESGDGPPPGGPGAGGAP
jgi:branched-chain amino acid transport system permease protein